MSSSFFIARRYLFSKKSQNVINIISSVSVMGIAVSTAALVIVLSALNGLGDLVSTLYTTFESDIKIESVKSKTFDRNLIDRNIYEVGGLKDYTEVIEEIAIFRHEEQFQIGILKGVEDPFLRMSEMSGHMEDGPADLGEPGYPLGLVGVQALQNLNALIYDSFGPVESFTIYTPNRGEEISRTNLNAFSTSQIPIVGTFSFNNDVDQEMLVIPIDYAAEIMDYKEQITSIEMTFDESVDLDNKKLELQSILGEDFKIVTRMERNKLINQTSKTEKWITTLLLAFIFFLATFNMVASITMLVLEKRDNLQTLRAMGAKTAQLHRIFFYEGLLITGFGLIIGLILGYFICWLQIQFGFIGMDGGHSAQFPVAIKIEDLFLILGITTIFGTLAAFLPSKFLIKRIVR